jgi:hypothetical protein
MVSNVTEQRSASIFNFQLIFYLLFNKAVSDFDFVASNDRMVVTLERLRMEEVVAYYKVLYPHVRISIAVESSHLYRRFLLAVSTL